MTVRRSLDYQGIARRAIREGNQEPTYDREIDISAVVFDEETKKRRFAVIDGAVQKARQEMASEIVQTADQDPKTPVSGS